MLVARQPVFAAALQNDSQSTQGQSCRSRSVLWLPLMQLLQTRSPGEDTEADVSPVNSLAPSSSTGE